MDTRSNFQNIRTFLFVLFFIPFISSIPVSISFPRLLTLTRIFHTGSLRGAANPDIDKEGDGLRRRAV